MYPLGKRHPSRDLVLPDERCERSSEHVGTVVVEGELLELAQNVSAVAGRLAVRLDELAEDVDTAGRVDSLGDEDRCVPFDAEREDGREMSAQLGRCVPGALFAFRSRRGERRQFEVELNVSVLAEEGEVGHPRRQLDDEFVEILLLLRARLVVGGERCQRLGESVRTHSIHLVSSSLVV